MQELVTGTDHDQAPILHDPYPVRQGTGTEQVVGTDQYRFSFQAEMVQELHQLGGAPGIQAGGRLIHHDIVGVFQQEGGDLYFCSIPLEKVFNLRSKLSSGRPTRRIA